VPRDRSAKSMSEGIPITYVPARNTVFLSLALAWAEVLGAFDLYVGVNCVDYSGYPDCRPEFLRAFETMANLATRAGVEGQGTFRIHAPLLTMSKDQIIARGLELGVNYALTHSCYDPTVNGLACGRCDSCRLRLEAFERLGMSDPVAYSAPGQG
ncbi:MAG TPA: 7-cyano-7-deazaguanine synthase, partial [Isosphaeraceae bacterium]|nr:7-cyano-7-deazaguanine synthase [Isosphaeraceae bacterium]